VSCVDINTGRLFRYRVELEFDRIWGVLARNAVYFNKKINGVFGGLLDALADVWGAIVGVLEAIAGYTTILETILTGASIAGSIMEIVEHSINGRWSDG